MSRKPRLSGRSLVITVGIIGFFALGFTTATYLGLFQNISIPNTNDFQNQPYSVDGAKFLSLNNVQHTVSHQLFENCLAYGSGESLTITCPTQYGYVYNAILDLPRDLANKFSDTVFSIRGISLTENLDGSVIIQYQSIYYKTNFFAS